MSQQHFVVYTTPDGGSTTLFYPFAAVDVIAEDQAGEKWTVSATHAKGSTALVIQGLRQEVANGVAGFLRDWGSSLERHNSTPTPGINLNALIESIEAKDSRILKPNGPQLVEQ
jgi:hypothetical protein